MTISMYPITPSFYAYEERWDEPRSRVLPHHDDVDCFFSSLYDVDSTTCTVGSIALLQQFSSSSVDSRVSYSTAITVLSGDTGGIRESRRRLSQPATPA